MTTRAKVALLRTRPEAVLEDYDRLFDLAGASQSLDPTATTILKDNISWHFPFPAANTTPWQLEGTVRALNARGYTDQVCVQNKTVVTDAFKGEDLNGYVPIFNAYGIPVRYNFREDEMPWVFYRPTAKMLVLDRIFPEGIKIPEYFRGKNIVHLPTVKCLTGDTELILADGTITSIKTLVERQIDASATVERDADGTIRAAGNVEVLSMAPDGEIRPASATWFWKTPSAGRSILRVRTRTGRCLTLTADHPVQTPQGWRAVGELDVGSRIAIARRVRIEERPQVPEAGGRYPSSPAATERLSTASEAGIADRLITLYRGGRSIAASARQVKIGNAKARTILREHDIALHPRGRAIRSPDLHSLDWWRWLGYLMAEGNIGQENGCTTLQWVNLQPELRADFKLLTTQLFGLEAKDAADGVHIYLYSARLADFLKTIGLPVPLRAGNKLVPPTLFRCSDREIAAFLSGYVDGDGHVDKRQAAVSVTTKSERLAHDVQSLFSRLGAVAFCKKIERRNPQVYDGVRTYWTVSVSGDGVTSLSEWLDLRHPHKRSLLAIRAEAYRNSRRITQWDVVPLPRELIRHVRTGLGLSAAATGKPSSVTNIECVDRNPTPRIARFLATTFERHDREGQYASEIARIKTLAHEDLAWDTIVEVEDISGYHAELYDLTVPETACFIANGLVAHNCHIYTTTTGAMKNAFGGLLNTRRHYTHSWIHETLVDLLAIQKEIHSGLFAVMDGTTAGNGPGPRTMFPVVKNVILASADQTAIDAVAAKLMGFDPLSIGYIRMAHDAGLGVGDPREIELTGDADLGNESWGFKVGDNGASRVGDVVWFGPLKPIQNLFMRTPLVNLFILGSETYHDYYRWPMRDKKTFQTWRRATPWGRLFTQYRRQGTLRSSASAGQTTAVGD